MEEKIVINRYLNGDYAKQNPDWDLADSPWKASKVNEILKRHSLLPNSLVEVGCGAGGVMVELAKAMIDCRMTGFDVAPDLEGFWRRISVPNITFVLGDYFQSPIPIPDLVLVLDVIEHVADPYEFLVHLRNRSITVLFHIPLDLSAVSVIREEPLLHVRRKVGHIHHYTKGLALSLLDECGFDVVEATYSGASFCAPNRSVKTKIMGVVRRMAGMLNRDVAVRIWGGDTLFVLARSRGCTTIV